MASRVNVEETSLVHARGSVTPDMTVLALDVSQVAAAALPTAFEYPFVEVIACPSDLARIEQTLAPHYRPDTHGDGYTIFERR